MPDRTATQHVPEGTVVLELRCPTCDMSVPIVGVLAAVLTTPSDDASSLKAVLRAKPIPHLCNQSTLFDMAGLDEASR